MLIYDKNEKCGAWMIDFSKTIPVPSDITITHRLPWQFTNHEDGFLVGLDNLIQVSGSWDLHRRSDMSAHVLLNLLNELRKRDKM